MDPGIRRRIFCLLLKEVHQVTDSLLVHAALLTGCEQTWLEEKLRQARELTFQREGRRETFQHRRCQALFNLYSLHDRIRESINPAERADLFRQLEKETRRLNRAKEALRRVSRRPSHREIASLLGLPKGTVDSGLYYLNQSLNFAAEERPIMRSPEAGLEPRR